jgi:hypothetical protein
MYLLCSSRVVITDKETLPCSLFACIPNVDIQFASVSPLWITTESWGEQFSFISAEDAAPRILVFFDFDVAIQETYLLPNLLSWLSRARVSSHNRIVLVPSEFTLSKVSDRILELSSVLMTNGDVVGEIQRSVALTGNVSPPIADSSSIKDLVKYPYAANPDFERETRSIARSCDVQFPSRLLDTFSSMYASMARHFPDDFSGRVSTASTLIPWLAQVRGQSVMRIYQEAVVSRFGKS